MPSFEIKRFAQLEYQAKVAVNTLCTNLSFAGGDIKKIMITRCHPQEGKSFISMNLMRSFASLGMRVVLVDADIRASALQSVYGIQIAGDYEADRYPGLTRYLAGRASVDEILGPTNIPNASMILSGRRVINSLPLLNTPRLRQLLDYLTTKFDIVLVDAPPVGTIIDAARIATSCDGTLFVVESGTVSRFHLQRSLSQIEQSGCTVLGTVLNRYDDREYGSKYYYSGGGYYSYYRRPNKSDNSESNTRKQKRSQAGKSTSQANKSTSQAGKTASQKPAARERK